VGPAPQYRIVLADEAEWSLSGSDTLRALTLKASTIAPLPTEEPGVDLEAYAGIFERIVRDTVGIHIKGIEDLAVTEDEIFVWVESRYSTESIFKDEMYELYDEIAGLTPEGWDPQIVLRFGSDSTDGWLQSSTPTSAWWDIEDQLDWERTTQFERKGRLCC
jgi:hypothetical protein